MRKHLLMLTALAAVSGGGTANAQGLSDLFGSGNVQRQQAVSPVRSMSMSAAARQGIGAATASRGFGDMRDFAITTVEQALAGGAAETAFLDVVITARQVGAEGACPVVETLMRRPGKRASFRVTFYPATAGWALQSVADVSRTSQPTKPSGVQTAQAAPATPAAPVAVDAVEETRIAAADGIAMDRPSSAGKAVAPYAAGQRIQVTGKVTGQPWLRVTLAGKVAYVRDDALKPVPGAQATETEPEPVSAESTTDAAVPPPAIQQAIRPPITQGTPVVRPPATQVPVSATADPAAPPATQPVIRPPVQPLPPPSGRAVRPPPGM